MTPAEAIDRLYDLRPGTTPLAEGSPHERPHKPLLILAALDLIDEGLASAERIPWCQELRDRFSARFVRVRKHNDQNTPENPFLYLQSEGFWQSWIEENGNRMPLQSTPLVNQIGKVFARFAEGFEHLMSQPATRQLFREALISRYFPQLRSDPTPKVESTSSLSLVAEDTPEYGRSSAFRRLVLDIYDHQCAACGLRIRLASGNPTNGLALCKNHHWAMDRDIIAPGPDLHWHVSKHLDPRRSNGEKELHELAGKSLLLPKDPAFHPQEEGLVWRRERLSA
jgi:putative restriction endonuclease